LRSAFSGGAHQHGGLDGHLPGSSANVERVGKLELSGRFGDVVPGQIADLSVYKDFAYLNSWNEETCTRGGTFVADIRNPKRPSEVAFIPALPKNYHGEGAHVISVTTRAFSGDLLAVNNETCADTTRGGRLRSLRRQRSAQPEDVGAGLRRFRRRGQAERFRHEVEGVPQRLPVDGRRQGLSRRQR